MSQTTEVLEHMEHAGHAGGHGDHGHGAPPKLGKYIGITMAVLGVLLAISSALMGTERTELIARMVDKANVTTRYQSVSMKYRLIQANLQQMNALLPSDPVKFKELEASFDDSANKISPAGDGPLLANMLRVSHAQVLNTVVPNTADLKRFVKVARSYREEAKAANAWRDSYDALIHGHEHASHQYEYGLLAAEIGIILASIALLLSSRAAWFMSLGLGVLCVVIVAYTNIGARSTHHEASDVVAKARTAYHASAHEKAAEEADEALFKSVDAMPDTGEIKKADAPTTPPKSADPAKKPDAPKQ
jgi:hypothetical protein